MRATLKIENYYAGICKKRILNETNTNVMEYESCPVHMKSFAWRKMKPLGFEKETESVKCLQTKVSFDVAENYFLYSMSIELKRNYNLRQTIRGVQCMHSASICGTCSKCLNMQYLVRYILYTCTLFLYDLRYHKSECFS